MPLLFIRRSVTFCGRAKAFILLLPLAYLLAGCSGTSPVPTLQATGYLSNKGSVRIWRKDLGRTPMTIVSDYVPDNASEAQIVTAYEYIDGELSQIKRQILAQPEVTEQVRFDANAKVTFNQRVLPDRKEMMSASAVGRLIYQAQRTLEMSAILLAGEIRLMQGRYRHGIIATCDGQPAALNLTPDRQLWLNKQLADSPEINLAWLVSSAGEELILATQDDICASEPTLDSL